MNLNDAVKRLRITDEYRVILEHLTILRENLIVDFKDPQAMENPQSLANIAGKIDQADTILLELGGPIYPKNVQSE
jgi:hypothetical protein